MRDRTVWIVASLGALLAVAGVATWLSKTQPTSPAPATPSLPLTTPGSGEPVSEKVYSGAELGRVFVNTRTTGAQAEIAPEIDAPTSSLILRTSAGEEASTAFGVAIERPGAYTISLEGAWTGAHPPVGEFLRVTVASWQEPRTDAEQTFSALILNDQGSFSVSMPVTIPVGRTIPEVRAALLSEGELRLTRLTITPIA